LPVAAATPVWNAPCAATIASGAAVTGSNSAASSAANRSPVRRSAASSEAGTSNASRASNSCAGSTCPAETSNPTPMDSASASRAVLGSATKLPPVTPRTVTMRFWLASRRNASRTVDRLTPDCAHSCGSAGSRSPGRSRPDVICSRRSSASTW
jgi:hypothetical protein